MGKSFKQIFPQRRHTDGQKAQEKRINVTNYQRNANRNYRDISSCQSEWPPLKKPTNNKFWRKGDAPALLVGVEIGKATMENSMELT